MMKHSVNCGGVLAVALAGLMIAGPAAAQKSKDTLRLAFEAPIKGIDWYHDPKPDTAMSQAAVFDGLVWFNHKTRKIEGLLAKSWTRTNPTTIEFELHENVKWHDGEPFDADDVVYTYKWLTDPKTKMRFKRNWAWVKSVEKLGPHKVRITAKKPTPFDLARHATFTAIVPEHLHGPLEKKVDFARKPVGTGPFRAVTVDGKQALVEKNPGFKHGGTAKPVSNINRIQWRFIPDQSTQIAQFLAGNLDAIRNAPLEQALRISERKGNEFSIGTGIGYQYITFDAKGRSGNKAMQDARVRKALLMAIDYDALVKLAAGAHKVERPGSMCWRLQAGCDFSSKQPEYDLAAARKLLADAGYAGGLEVEITTFTSPAIKTNAEAVAGMLQKVGVKASVDPKVIGAYRKKQRDGKIQMGLFGWSAGGIADVTGTLGFLMNPPPARDYHGDKTLKEMSAAMGTIMDPKARMAQGRKIFDHIIDNSYFRTILANPTTFVHRSEVGIDMGALNPYGVEAWSFSWK